MENKNKKLTITSYNCEYANDVRLPFLQKMFNTCDFLFLQEHGLFKSQFGWFDKIGDGVGKHGVSAMNECEALYGRPHGGAVIIWNKNLKWKVVSIEFDSDRVCAVNVHIGNGRSLLLICVYMPCDDRLRNGTLQEYIHALSDIEIICNMVDATYVCIAGDFNTDLTLDSYQTKELIKYVNKQCLSMCINDACSDVKMTYISRGSAAISLIDHFILSDNIFSMLLSYDADDCANNFSEHFPLTCVLDIDTDYTGLSNMKQPVEYRSAWHKGTADVIVQYQNI
jgi:hypothetical protein